MTGFIISALLGFFFVVRILQQVRKLSRYESILSDLQEKEDEVGGYSRGPTHSIEKLYYNEQKRSSEGEKIFAEFGAILSFSSLAYFSIGTLPGGVFLLTVVLLALIWFGGSYHISENNPEEKKATRQAHSV